MDKVRVYVSGKVVKVEKVQLKRWQRKYHRFYYIKERSIYVPVSEDFYTDFMRPQWKDEKAEQRSMDCIYKGTNQCDGFCDSCPNPVYQQYSLNRMEENGSKEVPVQEDAEECFLKKVAVKELHEVVAQLTDEDYDLLGVLIGNETEREAATRTGRSKTAVHKGKVRIIKFLKNILLAG